MFRTVKRIIDWCGDCKGKLYLGFLMTFLSHIFAALPLALAVPLCAPFGAGSVCFWLGGSYFKRCKLELYLFRRN